MTTRIILGDCRETLLSLKTESVQSIVTSPPYWALRSYLPDDHRDKIHEIGSEPTLQAWVETMVDVFTECRRVLRSDGTLFLNLGDAYAGSGRGGNSDGITGRGKDASIINAPRSDAGHGLKPKDMMGQPWRVAFALQDSGWWLRQEVIWAKPNPMPESTRDRCTKAHEHVFLLTKSERYFWNFEAMQEPVSGTANPRKSIKAPDGWKTGPGSHGTIHDQVREKGKTAARTPKAQASAEHGGRVEGKAARMEDAAQHDGIVDTRNPRSVWTIPIHGFKGAHFATFPPALAERCITAGTKPGDVVLDPFGGAGTVGLVAERMQRNSILLELDERSVAMARDRITEDAPMLSEVSIHN